MLVDPRLEIIKSISIAKSRVLLSPQLIFLCGGQVDIQQTCNHSIRNMFMNQSAKYQTDDVQFVLAENFKDWKDGYSSLSDFENDIANISSKIVVIPETAGSLAELGLFFGNKYIREKMTVVMHGPHHDSESFIKHGILNPLEELDLNSVLPYEINHADIEAVSTSVVDDAIDDVISECKKLDKSEEFSRVNNGHVLFLMFQIIDLFRALTITEIRFYMLELGFDLELAKLKSSLYLLQTFGLVSLKKRGRTYFYFSNPTASTRVDLKHSDPKKKFDYTARLLEVVEYYEFMSKKDSNFRKRSDVIKTRNEGV